MKIEIKRWDNNEIIVCGEYESVKDCLERNKNKSFYRADLSSANLRWANLSSADLSSANLSSANLSSADLSSANLSSANLRWADLSLANLSSANLSSADLSSASTKKRYIQISCIGSRKGLTTYCFEDDEVLCGCWKGSLEEFEKRVNDTHKDNKQYLAEYLGFITYIKGLTKPSA